MPGATIKQLIARVLLLVYGLQLVPRPVLADFLCPQNMISFATADSCDSACIVGCIETGNMSCGYTDDEGNGVFLSCIENGLVCPLGDFQCDTAGLCRKYGECTSSNSPFSSHFCPVTKASFKVPEECQKNCFYESLICSNTGEQFHGMQADPLTGALTVVPMTQLYDQCADDCFACPGGMYFFKPQKVCVTRTCAADDPFCDQEIERTVPACEAGFVFSPDTNRCEQGAEFLYTACVPQREEGEVFACPDTGEVYRELDAAARCDFHCQSACLTLTEPLPTGHYVCPLNEINGLSYPTSGQCDIHCREAICDIGEVSGDSCVMAPLCPDDAHYNPGNKMCEKVIVAFAQPAPGTCQPFDVQLSCETYYSHSSQWICKENKISYVKPANCKDACQDDGNCVGVTSVAEAIEAWMRMDSYAEWPTFEECNENATAFCTTDCDPAGKCLEQVYPDQTEYQCDVTEYQYATLNECNTACCTDALESCRDACSASCPEGDAECVAACEASCAPCSYTCSAVKVPVPSDWKRVDTLALYPALEECEQAYFADCFADCRTKAYCRAITRDDTSDWTCDISRTRYQTEDECKASCKTEADCVVSPDPVCPISVRLQCVDPGLTRTYDEADTSQDYVDYQDDGEVDGNGACDGELYLFSGSVNSCKPPGMKTSWHNCCDADGDVVNDLREQISSFEMVMNAGKAVYYATQAILAYDAMQAAILAGDAFAMEAVAATYGADVATIATTAGSATEAGVQGIINGFNISPTGAVISLAIYFAVELLTKTCSADDVYTAALDELGLCHYLTRKCTTKTVFGCVQRTKYYCCFSSRLARILHEQGRPQLQAWAGFADPFRHNGFDCRGFTPEEFAMLDLSKIDLTEYYGDLQTRINSMIQDDLQKNLQERAKDNMEIKVPAVPVM